MGGGGPGKVVGEDAVARGSTASHLLVADGWHSSPRGGQAFSLFQRFDSLEFNFKVTPEAGGRLIHVGSDNFPARTGG